MNYKLVEAGDIRGVEENTMYGEVFGEWYPVTALMQHKRYGTLPVLDIPMMDDVQWQLQCLKDRLAAPDKYRPWEDVDAHITKLTAWLKSRGVSCEAAR